MKQPKRGNVLDNFLLKQFFFISQKMSSFKTWFTVGSFRFQKSFDIDVLNFHIVIFWLSKGLRYIYQKLGDCFQSSGHPE